MPEMSAYLIDGRIAAEIVAGDEVGADAHLVDQRADAHAERLHAHEVDLLLEEPPGIVFAKPGRLHEREGFVLEGVRRQGGFGALGTWSIQTEGGRVGTFRISR